MYSMMLIKRALVTGIYTLSRKMTSFVSPKTLLRFRVRNKVRVRAGVSGNTFSNKYIRFL